MSLLRRGCVHSIGVMFRGVAIVLLATLTTGLVSAAPQSAADLLAVPKLLDDLSDADRAVRDEAAAKLAAIGTAARPDLIKAARSDDPERRVRAAEILRKLPWYTDRDDRAVRALLERYGTGDERVQMALLWQISDVDGGPDVLLRILGEEPGDAVRWFIVALLTGERDSATQKKFLALDVARDDPPVLVLVGNTLIERDRRRALELFRRAIEAEGRRPAADIGVLTIAFDALVDDAVARGDVEGAAALLRRQVPRDVMPQLAYRRMLGQGEPHSFARLMALHTYFGPLSGFEDDLRAWGNDRVYTVPVDVGITRFIGRLAPAPPVPWEPVELSARQHLAAGGFLMRNKLNVAAEAELMKVLASSELGVMPKQEADACESLAELIAARNDDESAASMLERAVTVKQDRGVSFTRPQRRSDDDVWAEIHFRRARVAHTRGDATAEAKQVRALLQLMPTHGDETIEMITWLKSTDRGDDARTLFGKVYVQADARLQSASPERKAGMKNDLAWLCARAGERLTEALKLAHEAVEAQPDNAAFLDTLAEACFRNGKVDEAIQYETRASRIEPDNEFMQQQLARFRAGIPAAAK
jgi:tetratricopeptide (TPR) repeat protein